MSTMFTDLPLCVIQTEHSQPWFSSVHECINYWDLPLGSEISVKNCRHGVETKKSVDTIIGKFTAPTRWIVCADEQLFHNVISRLMFINKLESSHICFIANNQQDSLSTSVMPFFQACHPLSPVKEQALIRDERGAILVSPARIIAQEGTDFIGETYVDESKIAGDIIRCIEMEPLGELPGMRARARKRIGWSRWKTGRAVQTGGEKFTTQVKIGNVWVSQPVRQRITWYRHHIPINICQG